MTGDDATDRMIASLNKLLQKAISQGNLLRTSSIRNQIENVLEEQQRRSKCDEERSA